MRRGDRTEETEVLLRRRDVLERLCRSPAQIRDLVDETAHSRSTINRAINELEEMEFVDRGNGGIEATTAGRLASERLTAFFGELDDIFAAEGVLDSLPPGTDVGSEFVAGSDAVPADGPTPYQPLERYHDALDEADGYRALVPTIEDPRHVRVLYEHVVTDGNPAELVVTPDIFETLREEFPRRVAVMAEEDGFSVFVGTLPSFGLALFGGEGTDSATAAQVVVAGEGSGVHGVLVNDDVAALRWAEDRYASVRDGAVDRTDDLIADSDGGVSSLDGHGGYPLDGGSLPATLEREGFVRVDASYFRNVPVADPTTAWRTGLSLGEVHTGYVFDRTVREPEGDGAPGTDAETDTSPTDEAAEMEGVELAAMLEERLAAGHDCVVLGPPGSGKSTTCKQVATSWYDEGRGPVLYRESDHGQPVSAVETLRRTVAEADGHALVVVEDAVRPDTAAVLDATEELADRDDVSFLLDARESEWQDPETPAPGTDALVTHVPPLSRAECEAFVAHFERTAGRSVDVSPDQLWSAIHEQSADADTHEMLRLIHRLATYADPLADEPTALEDSAAAVYEELATDELALAVGILANTLNAAGLGVDRELLYAVGTVHDAGEGGSLSAVDTAIDRLDGRVLFAGDGGYRTVHEEWSVAFLAHVLEREGEETATRLFGDSVSSLLALADDTETCRRITNHTGDQLALRTLLDDPAAWADRCVRAVYLMGQKRPKLAPLFGDGSSDSIQPPTACSASVLENRPGWLGEVFLAGGYYDRAERAFERLSRAERGAATERLLGLARVAINRGEYDSAIASCQECLSLLEARGRSDDVDITRIRARLYHGEALFELGEFDSARDRYRTVLSECRAGEYRHLTAKTLYRLGRVSLEQGEFEQAREFCESSLEIRQELSDWSGEAETLDHLGNIARKRGQYDRARELCERSLEISHLRGDRKGIAQSLHSLGNVSVEENDYSRAVDFYERSLERYRALDDRAGESSVLHGLGVARKQQGNLGRAVELYEQSLDIDRELGDKHGVANSLNNLGTIEGIRGNYDRAAGFYEECLELQTVLDARDSEAKILNNLGQLELRRGNFRQAHEFYDRSLAIKREIEEHSAVTSTLNNLGTVATQLGNEDQATEYFEQALETAARIGDSDERARSLRGLGALALESGALDRAGEYIDRALDTVEGGHLVELRIRLTDVQLALARGDVDLARSSASELAEQLEAMGANYWLGRSKRLLGRISAEGGEFDTASERYVEAVDCFESLDSAHEALVTLELLLELPTVEEGAADEYSERARRLWSGAPAEVTERHEHWVSGLTRGADR